MSLMSNKNTDIMLADIESTNKMCQLLMQTPHYKKMGMDGIFAIVQKARSLNIHPLEALNGALYYVNGKVEMSSRMMNKRIRMAGHSITKDPKSDENICILHGKRTDTQDIWTESYSIEEAKKAGIYRVNGPWDKYPKDMLFARALSRLARSLFADLIDDCYVEGEIEIVDKSSECKTALQESISQEQVKKIEYYFEKLPDYKDQVMKVLEKDPYKISNIKDIPQELYDRIINGAMKKLNEKKDDEQEFIPTAINDSSD